jgi:adenylate kinase family enzyme
MNRVLILGSAGAGKTTLAHQIGKFLNLPIIHLDAYYWKPGWEPTPMTDWWEVVEELVAGDAWVMDGNYRGTLTLRLMAADTVIFLDFPRWLCLWRVFKRALRYAGRTRPDMAPGCREKIDLPFLRWIWTYPTRARPQILTCLEVCQSEKTVIILRSPAEVQQFLDNLRQVPRNPPDSEVEKDQT